MTYEQIENKIKRAMIVIKTASSPRDTGNLLENAIKLRQTPNGWQVYIDKSVAGYADFIDRFPQHERWWEEIAELFYIELKRLLNEE